MAVEILQCWCSSSSLPFTIRNTSKYSSSLLGSSIKCFPARIKGPKRVQVGIRAETQSTWLPGLDPPSYLDGSLAGDFGFDPLGLGEDPKRLKLYLQPELVHSLFAMAGVAEILVTDLLRVSGMMNLPVWYEAGAIKFQFASTRTLLIVQLLLMGYILFICFRWICLISVDLFDSFCIWFFCLTLFLLCNLWKPKGTWTSLVPDLKPKRDHFLGSKIHLQNPGGPVLNPLGLAKDIKSAHEWKLKEIKNGRLAMVAMLGIMLDLSIILWLTYQILGTQLLFKP